MTEIRKGSTGPTPRSGWIAHVTGNRMVAGVFAIAGVAAGVKAYVDYPLGTITRMGAGFVPLALSVGLVLLAVIAMFIEDDETDEPAEGLHLRAAAFILMGIVTWALLIDTAGFFVATVPMVLLAGMAQPDNTWKHGLIVAALTAIGGYVLFVTLIGIPLTPFGR
ncbi:tripartite tricarboxylate transporter TctB family protein [Microbaculum marinisediminis]|uniref:Tripartite tricarboxylate transporter TctB family protein n=1 Tax=Microbaculum marinisediminis TaxID=2931392 RepID=A0AAW5R079_9HYPH|nr:tripartite tricarboxylate transporter TctB family protein [Microbaculum sp. A6E488]MCT8973680.1 tripartite tricarboxylate transporter TctB family protein [Microbaculum sp. A6E488]